MRASSKPTTLRQPIAGWNNKPCVGIVICWFQSCLRIHHWRKSVRRLLQFHHSTTPFSKSVIKYASFFAQNFFFLRIISSITLPSLSSMRVIAIGETRTPSLSYTQYADVILMVKLPQCKRKRLGTQAQADCDTHSDEHMPKTCAQERFLNNTNSYEIIECFSASRSVNLPPMSLSKFSGAQRVPSGIGIVMVDSTLHNMPDIHYPAQRYRRMVWTQILAGGESA